MSRVTTFTFRVTKDERRMLDTLAKNLQRSQSDAIRLLIREATRELPQPAKVKTPRELGDLGGFGESRELMS